MIEWIMLGVIVVVIVPLLAMLLIAVVCSTSEDHE